MISESRSYAYPYPKKAGHFLLCVRFRLEESEKWTEKRKVSPAKSPQEASKLAAQLEKDLLSGKVKLPKVDTPKDQLTFAEVFDKYQKALELNQSVDSTISSCQNIFDKYFLPTLGKIKINQVNSSHWEKLKSNLTDCKEKETVSGKTLNYYLTRLSAFLNWAHEENYLEELPKVKKLKFKIRTEKDKRVQNHKDLVIDNASFQAAVKKAGSDLHLLAMLYLGGHMALRLGEMAGLRWCDVDLRAGFLRVENQKDSKGLLRHTKTSLETIPKLPLTKQTKEVLDKLKKKYPDSEYVIIKNGKVPHRHSLIFWMHKLFDSGNIHALRHYALSEMARNNLPQIAIMNFARHKSFRMTNKYFDSTYEELEKVSKALSAIK